MKYITLFAFLMFASSICIGQNHLFDSYEIQINQSYRYNGPPSQEAIQGAFDILYNNFGQKKFNRKISYNANDWSNDVIKFLKVDFENIPLLNEPDLKSDNLSVIGFTKTGEFLQFIEYKQESVKIERPGGWQLQNYGDWYQVKTLNGEYGWIFAKPYGLDYAFASVVEKVIPKPIDSSNKSDFPIGTIIIVVVIILGIIVFVSSLGSSTTSTTTYDSSSYSSPSYDSGDSSSGSYSASSNDSEDSSNDNFINDEEEVEHGTRRCLDCDNIYVGYITEAFAAERGNGECSDCHGTGISSSDWLVKAATFRQEGDIPCEKCSGTGQCQNCGGNGRVYY